MRSMYFQKKLLKSKLELLTENPSHPSLRTKRIQGTIDLFECSVNMDIRIIWYYEDDRMIILVDIGHHDILKQFLITESARIIGVPTSLIQMTAYAPA